MFVVVVGMVAVVERTRRTRTGYFSNLVQYHPLGHFTHDWKFISLSLLRNWGKSKSSLLLCSSCPSLKIY